MNKLLAALLAGFFAIGTFAATPAAPAAAKAEAAPAAKAEAAPAAKAEGKKVAKKVKKAKKADAKASDAK